MTNQSLPAPLVPADVDLRGYEFMPLYGVHLFGSEFNGRCSDAGWRAGVTLWWAAWNQVPAASLPSDDVALCRLADLGRDLKAWKKIKAEALHGFVLCSDGRLYHKFLAPKAIDAWERRVGERERKQKWRDKRRGHPMGGDGDGDGDRDGTSLLTGTGRGTETENLKTPYPAVGGEPEIANGSQEGEEQPDDDGRNPRARRTNPRAMGTNPRAVAEKAEAAEVRQRRDALWRPRLAQFEAAGRWDSAWGPAPSLNPAVREAGVLLPISLWDEFRAIALARAGPGGKAA